MQCLLQALQGPSRRAILFPVRGAAGVSQDALPLLWAIDPLGAAAMTRNHSGDAFAVEASDQVGDGIAGAAARCLSRLSEGAPLCDGQQGFGTGNLGRGPGLSAGDLL